MHSLKNLLSTLEIPCFMVQLILHDEPTSALYALHKQKMPEAVSNLLKGKTVFLISHCLSANINK